MLHLFINPTATPGAGDGGKHNPFATLAEARDALRAYRRAHGGPPPFGVTVWLADGDYWVSETFMLTAEDGGTAEAPVVIRAAEGAVTRLLGGVPITDFQPVTDPAVLARLDPAARSQIRVTDLRAAGIDDCGHFSRRGFGTTISPAHLELFYGGKPMTVAQWPKAGQFDHIADVVTATPSEWDERVGELSDGFRYNGDRPKRWATHDNIWVHGYWCYDWANTYEQVASLDPETRTVVTVPPHGKYGFKPGQRFYFLNILEELTEPGEFYVDAKQGLLYFWPPEEDAEALVSVLEGPLIHLDGASFVTLEGLTLEAGRGSGIEVDGGESVRIERCTLRNLGNLGVVIRDGMQHAVYGCEIYGTGDGAINMSGGERETLTPAGHAVEQCHLHHYARWSRTYQAGVHANGVGIRVAHNLMHDAPHKGILYWGNDFTLEANEIYRVCLETGDAGAIYTGRDYTYRGNVVRDNFIHHMGGLGIGTSAIYMDDCVSGHEIAGNVVWDGDAIWLGGGRDFHIHDNVFIGCKGAVCFDARGISPHPIWQEMVNITMRERIDALPWAWQVPEIAAILPHYTAGGGVPPEGNVIEHNLCVDCEIVRYSWPEEAVALPWLTLRDNVVTDESVFLDPAWGDFRPKPGAPFPPCPAGITDHPPALVRSRLELLAHTVEQVTLRLSLRNDGVTPAAGCMRLPDTSRWAYTLAPGEITEREFTLSAPDKTLTLEAYDAEGTARPARLVIAIPAETDTEHPSS